MQTAGAQHQQQTAMEHQMTGQGFDMSRVGSVQSQIGGQPIRDADALLRPYIHEYLMKNELTSTAAQLRTEGGLGEQPPLPIQVQKGVLSE